MFGRNRADVILPVTIDQTSMPSLPIRGMVGVGTWATQAEFKDMEVTKNGKTVWQFDGTKKGWKTTHGKWDVVEGALRQTGGENDVRAIIGDKSWSDYTFTLKARKLSGKEGFLIIFGQQSNEKSWWNIGGWGNTEDAIEGAGITTDHVPNHIETGRWYDIRIELKGPSIRCFLDSKQIFATQRMTTHALYAVAGRQGDDIILKVVNAGQMPVEAAVELRGEKAGALRGQATVLSYPDPLAENSFESPDKIAPRMEAIEVDGPQFTRTFPANSVTVLRLSR